MEQNKFEGWTIVGWSSTIPNVTEKEFFDYIHALEPVCSAISWSEWKNPKQLPNLKSYKIQVKEKILNPTPAKPESQSKPDTDTTSVNAKTLLIEASQESASPDGKSSTASTQQTETGGGFTIISMGKIGDEESMEEREL